MTLQEILTHRRAVRDFDASQPIDPERVRQCLELATLAPTSSNLQLWECYHVTNAELIKTLGVACLNQPAVTSAQQLVIFVVRPDYVYRRAQASLADGIAKAKQFLPEEMQAKRIQGIEMYYNRFIPLQYRRFFGILGGIRKGLVQLLGLFRPMPRQVSEAAMRTVIHKSCALVAQTFMLAMSEAGYDTCPLEGFDSWRVKRALGLPYSAKINMVISCGIRSPQGVLVERFRVPFEEVYHCVE